MVLRIEVDNAQQHERMEHPAGPLELGRGPQQKFSRLIIDDQTVSRDQLRLEELANGRVKLENLSTRNPLRLDNQLSLAVGQTGDFAPPLAISVGKTRVVIERAALGRSSSVAAKPQTQIALTPEETGLVALDSIDLPPRTTRSAARIDLRGPTSGPAPESLMQWLQTIVDLQQSPAGSAQFFEQAAQALIGLVGLDLGLVLTRVDRSWAVVGSAAANDRVCVRYSHTLLDHVASQARTFYQDLDQLRTHSASLADIESAVVSPIFGLHGEVVGALYGVRTQDGLIARGGVDPLEAQLVQLLAAAVGSNLVRSLAARTRVQFEQFFSPELVRELERDPQLLEGRSEEITVLQSDLRGFTALSQRLGAEKTCRMIRDMMERLSERIVEHGGVIVDYAGDGILAMWNAPAKQADHAARACRAALAMLAELPALNQCWGHETDGAPLALGIGINTGEAQVGNTGSSRKFKYGPHGHTVNLASRVQDATKHLGLPLLVADQTRRQLSPDFATRRLGQVRLPGVKGPVSLHEVRGAPVDAAWTSLRDIYEQALQLFEAAQWPRACEVLLPLVAKTSSKDQLDVPTLKLMRRAWECLELRPDWFEPIIEIGSK